MSKKIVITGGVGHIGSALLNDSRLKAFDEIIVVDSFVTSRYASLFNLPNKIKLVKRDIVSDSIKDVLKGVDTVVHLAGTVNAGETIDKDGLTREVNYLGAIKVAKAAAQAGAKCFVFLSSASIYGPMDSEDVRAENTKHIYPQSPYAKYKYQAEQPILDLDIPKVYVFRFGTIFGYSPGMRFHTVTNKFLWNAITGNPVTIWKPGTGKRPYLSLHHAKDAIFNIMKNKPKSGVYNAVSEHWNPLEITDVIKRYKPELDVKFVTPRILNQDGYLLDCSKAEKACLYTTSPEIALTHLEEYAELMSYNILGNLECFDG
jgi:nucleoside-diphosphate-sugar epimerase